MDKEIILKELKFAFSRSAGSGGQHVNKVSTKVELSYAVGTSLGLTMEQKSIITDKLGNRINADGVLKLHVSTTRSQLKNRQLATKKIFKLIAEALRPEKKRKKMKPSAKLKAERLKNKKHHSEKKNQRKKVELPKQFDLFSFKCVSFVSNIKMLKNMNLYRLSFLLLTPLFLVLACKPSVNPERAKIYDKVMEIHDEVMPEMKTIHYLEKGLKKKIGLVQSQDSLIMMKATLKRVEEAGQGMMDWMHNLNVPGKKVPDAEAIAYLKQEKDKISLVSTKMKKAILSGQSWLDEK